MGALWLLFSKRPRRGFTKLSRLGLWGLCGCRRLGGAAVLAPFATCVVQVPLWRGGIRAGAPLSPGKSEPPPLAPPPAPPPAPSRPEPSAAGAARRWRARREPLGAPGPSRRRLRAQRRAPRPPAPSVRPAPRPLEPQAVQGTPLAPASAGLGWPQPAAERATGAPQGLRRDPCGRPRPGPRGRRGPGGPDGGRGGRGRGWGWRGQARPPLTASRAPGAGKQGQKGGPQRTGAGEGLAPMTEVAGRPGLPVDFQ